MFSKSLSLSLLTFIVTVSAYTGDSDIVGVFGILLLLEITTLYSELLTHR